MLGYLTEVLPAWVPPATAAAALSQREQRWPLGLFLVALWAVLPWAFGPIGQWDLHVTKLCMYFSHQNLWVFYRIIRAEPVTFVTA